MPEIQELRAEVNELDDQIQDWLQEIEILQSHIELARESIAEKTNEIERLESEAQQRDDFMSQILDALETMSVDQLESLVSSLPNGEISTIQPANEPAGRTVLVINNDEENEYEITDEMKNSYLTLVGTSHQKPWMDHNFVPAIGTKIVLSKETETSNCYGLIAEELQDDYADQLDGEFVLGILPTNGSPKTEELADLDLPCKTHQSMWNNSDLDELYVVTGNIPGKYITLCKYEEEIVEEIEEESSSSSSLPHAINVWLTGSAITEEEAREKFNDQMNDACQILEVLYHGGAWIIKYDDHRRNHMEDMRRFAAITRP